MSNTTYTAPLAAGARLWQAIGALLIVAVLLASGQVARASTMARTGLVSDTHYVSEQFVFELEWEEPWEAGPDTVDSAPGEYELVAVAGPDGSLRCLLLFLGNVEDVFNATLRARANSFDDLEVIATSEGTTGLGLPYFAATLSYELTAANGERVQVMEYVEVSPAYTVDMENGALVLSLFAEAESLADAFEDAEETFLYNQGAMGPLFSDQPAVDGIGRGGNDRGGRGDRGGDRAGSNAEAEYLAIIGAEIEALTDGVNRFYALYTDSSFGDQASLQELSGILNSWIAAYDYAQSLTPPPGYEAVHAAYVDFTGYLATAAMAMFDQDMATAVAMLEQALQQGMYLAELMVEVSG